MIALSEFQSLPGHIIENICNCIGNNYCKQFSNTNGGSRCNINRANYDRRPLLKVSRRWRIVTQEYLYQNVEIMCQDNVASIRHMAYNFCTQNLSKETNSYVKTVSLFLSWTNVFSGKATDMLNQLYTKLAFLKAQRLQVYFSAPYIEKVENSSSLITVVDQFTSKVREMVPNARILQTTVYSFGHQATQHELNLCNRVLNNMCHRLRAAEYHGWGCPQQHGLYVDKSTGLTSLTYNWGIFGEEAYALFYTHAHTLQTLKLQSGSIINYSRLVQKPDGLHVVYSQLQRLQIKIEGVDLNNYQWKTPINIVFFPALRHFVHNHIYPFEDDTVFRGNRDTIESINISLDLNSYEALLKHEVFSKRHPWSKLRHITVNQKINSSLVANSKLPAEILQHCLMVSPALQSFQILVNDIQTKVTLVSCLPNIPCAKTLQILVIPHIALRLDEILHVLEQLPALSDLHCKPAGLGMLLDNISESMLITQLYNTHDMSSSRFKFWQVVRADLVTENELALTTMLLAMLCPNFTYAAIPPTKRAIYEDTLCESIQNEPFKKFSAKIQRLLLRG